ncbi:hypothetical protein Poly24_34080 [Rosistilla carotiformis]|uniref:DUF155 domain-containing protein n=1 Tax=Rosistilla carotiformis TaxID=2528017 RepID=A0A518JVX7_9BACT|nr:hypothetical protein [Rosistilla carotiformis]QDV69691.1 hypothetical protein Poly24_34080 [Rosistilla carotiformis]
MIAKDIQRGKASTDFGVFSELPFGSEIQQIAFVSEHRPEQKLLLALPMPFRRYAVNAESAPDPQTDESHDRLQIMTIPTSNHQDPELQAVARHWVGSRATEQKLPLEMMTLQGAQVFWTTGRVAVLAPEDRLDSVCLALIENCWYEAELRDIEQLLGESWPQMEADAPLAFTFDEKSLSKQPQLKKRFQQLVGIRARQSQLGPFIHQPHLHPPTLASQVGERYRERSRMLHRHEFLGEQLEVFERIYDALGQRASDFVQSRTGHILEWIIIVLLLTQLLLWGFELLTSAGQ